MFYEVIRSVEKLLDQLQAVESLSNHVLESRHRVNNKDVSGT